MTQYKAMQTETGDSFEDSGSGNLDDRSDRGRQFELSFDGNLFGADAEHSDTDFGFEHVGETVLQGYNNLESKNFDVTDSSTSFGVLRSAATARDDSSRGRSKRTADASNL